MIRAVTFDLDGVYFASDSFSKFKQALGITNFDDNDMFAFKTGKLSEIEFWNKVRSQFNLNQTDTEISQLLADSYQLNQNVVDTVKKVRSLGIKTCLCTNNFPTRINALQDKFHFLDDFDVKVFSYQTGAVKPDLKIFQVLVGQSGCQPGEIIFADDKEANVISARSLGVNAFIYTDFTDFISRLQQFGLAI
jgi:epoxide hydrolase-like predicted phosphatase